MDILVTEVRELAENVLKWREQQKFPLISQNIQLKKNSLHKHDVIVPPLPVTSKVNVQAINASNYQLLADFNCSQQCEAISQPNYNFTGIYRTCH